jgi:4-hydroxy-3-methylbut-2-en-1-yl diphosphate synthase IspG/GcpE
MAKKGALANLDVDAAIDEIASGALTREIAARYGVNKSSIRDKLEAHPGYTKALARQADALVQEAIREHKDMSAEIPIIARARARASLYLDYAKAHNPAYAAKQQITQVSLTVVASEALSVDAGSLLSQVRGLTIDGSAHRVGATMGATTIDGDSKPVDNQ